MSDGSAGFSRFDPGAHAACCLLMASSLRSSKGSGDGSRFLAS